MCPVFFSLQDTVLFTFSILFNLISYHSFFHNFLRIPFPHWYCFLIIPLHLLIPSLFSFSHLHPHPYSPPNTSILLPVLVPFSHHHFLPSYSLTVFVADKQPYLCLFASWVLFTPCPAWASCLPYTQHSAHCSTRDSPTLDSCSDAHSFTHSCLELLVLL